MSLINAQKIKGQIAWHESQIKILMKLMEIGSMLGGAEPSRAVGKVKAVKRGRKPKKKRGAMTSAIKAVLESSSKPVSSGDIRKELENQGLVEKGSSTIYTLLSNMAKRGALSKTAKGYAIATAEKGKTKAKRKTK